MVEVATISTYGLMQLRNAAALPLSTVSGGALGEKTACDGHFVEANGRLAVVRSTSVVANGVFLRLPSMRVKVKKRGRILS
jgi:hypothetical protein